MIDTRDQFLRLVCDELKISPLDVMSKRRDGRTSMARHLIMWGLHQYPEATTTQIGQLMGRDHATVCYGIGAVEINVTMPYHKEARQILTLIKQKGENLQCERNEKRVG